MWCHSVPCSTGAGTTFVDDTQFFLQTNNNWLVNNASWKLERNGVISVDACDDIRKHYNTVEYQKVCWGGVRLHAHNATECSNAFDYPVAAQILLTPPDICIWSNLTRSTTTAIPFGISNNNPTE